MKKKDKKEIIIDEISKARRKNNHNWMKLLKLAMDVAPHKSKIILRQINNQDRKISKLVEKLSRK